MENNLMVNIEAFVVFLSVYRDGVALQEKESLLRVLYKLCGRLQEDL